MRKIIIDNNNKGQRIDKFLLKFMKDMPKSFLYKMIRKKNIKLNSKKIEGNEIINLGDEIDIFMTDEVMINFGANKDMLDMFDNKKDVDQNEKMTIEEKIINKLEQNKNKKEVSKEEKMRRPKIDIVYEDNEMIIVNKPENVLVHPDESDGSEETILSEVIGYLEYKKDKTYLASRAMNFRPAICNRLDRNTKGLVIVCKNFSKTQKINRMIKDHEVEKRYLAVVCGKVQDDFGELINYYEKDEDNNEASVYDDETENSKEVKLKYKVIKRGFETSLLEIELITGKSHQIRAQLAHFGHPIVGDMKYGDDDINEKFKIQMKVKSQLLCAYKLKIEDQIYKIDCDFEKYVR